MASTALRVGVVRVAEAAGAAHANPAGQRGVCSLQSCPTSEALLSVGGFRIQNALLLLNSSKASQQKFPFLSFTYMSFFPEKQVTDWI